MNGWEYILIWVGFLFVSVASSQLAVVFPKIKLPLITGYLFIGIAAGPYVLDFLTKEDLPKLAPVNQFVLAFIGFSAGAELFLPELRDLFKTIFVTVGAISVLTFALVTAIMRGLLSSNVGSFVEEGTPIPGDTSGVAKVSSACMVGIAMLVASIMTARSPASAIAIAKELRAKGPFTRAFLGVTVVSDVVVLVLFAISAAFARGQCTGEGFSGESVLTLVASLVIAVVLGYFGLGKLIVFLLYLKPNIKLPPKWLILPIGFGIFKLNEAIADATLEHIGHEVGIEPLLMTIVAGYVATNQSRNRRMFLSMLQKVGPYVFIPFFTLTGASLDLRVFVRSALLAVIIAIVRVVAIFGGSIIGGVLAKAPKEHTKYMWLSLITQAGVSLGLAGEINFMFPDWGPACATAVVGVIMLNQIVGPILCKIAIKKVHEHGKAKASDDEEGGRTALILGINGYSLALAHRLRSTHWRVVMADYEESKLGHALRLNGADHDEDPHDQSVDSRAIQKKKKVFYGLKEEKSPQPPQGTIINASAGDITPSDPSDPSETPDQPPPLPTAESLHTSNAPPPPITNEGAFSIVQKKPPPPAEHNEHEPVIYDVNAKLIKQEEKSELALEGEGADVGIQWNYKELSAGMDLKKDVIICMLDTEAVNILACGYFKDKLKFGRVIGAVHAPTSVDMYIKAGAYPVYSFSSSIDVLYQCVTAKRPNAAALRHMISFESENYPSNLELLPHLLPPDLSHDEIEDIRATHEAMAPVNLIDIDLIDNSGPVGQDIPLQPAHPVERLRNVVRDGFSMTGQRLRELPGQLRDPIGLVNRSVQQMNVVPDSQRDEYLDSIAALHDTQPVTTNPIWLDLLGSPNTDRRMESQFTSDQPQLHGTFRTDRSVFEEYQGMDNNSNLNPNPNPNASSSNFASFFLPSKKP